MFAREIIILGFLIISPSVKSGYDKYLSINKITFREETYNNFRNTQKLHLMKIKFPLYFPIREST